MKIVLRYNRKKNDLDYIPWPEPGPVPPIIDPPAPDEPKDGAPPEHTTCPRKARNVPKA